MNCFIYYVCIWYTYDGLRTHICYYNNTKYNFTLVSLLFLVIYHYYFRFLEQPIVGMFTCSTINFIRGSTILRLSFSILCVYIQRNQDLLNQRIMDGISNYIHYLLYITYRICLIYYLLIFTNILIIIDNSTSHM